MSINVFSEEVNVKKKIAELKSSNKTTVISAIHSLGKVPTIESTNALVNKLKVEKDNYLKIQIIEALTLHNSSTAIAGILSALDDTNQYVRQAVMINLGYFGDNEQIGIAIANRLDKETEDIVKLSAINTLGQHKTKTAVTTLGKVIKDEKNINIRKNALRSLEKINTKEALLEIEKYKTDTGLLEEVRKILDRKKKK